MNTISKGYEDISVEVIDYNEKLAEHSWNCYRMTWNYLQNKPYDVNDNDVNTAINNIIKVRALPMPREQAIITFRINNISRVCLAQLTRQRKAAFNVESQMPCPVNHNVIAPLNIYERFYDKAEKLVKLSQDLYDEMIAAGIPPQDARYMLMHGQTTSLVYVVDINTFISSFGFRCENNLSDEINLIYRLMKKQLIDKLKEDFTHAVIDRLTFEMYTRIIASADAFGAHQKVGQNYDYVFGNSFKRYPDKDDEVKAATDNCDYDYTQSAWYLELQRMDKSLLFDGEAEMIERWKK